MLVAGPAAAQHHPDHPGHGRDLSRQLAQARIRQSHPGILPHGPPCRPGYPASSQFSSRDRAVVAPVVTVSSSSRPRQSCSAAGAPASRPAASSPPRSFAARPAFSVSRPDPAVLAHSPAPRRWPVRHSSCVRPHRPHRPRRHRSRRVARSVTAVPAAIGLAVAAAASRRSPSPDRRRRRRRPAVVVLAVVVVAAPRAERDDPVLRLTGDLGLHQAAIGRPPVHVGHPVAQGLLTIVTRRLDPLIASVQIPVPHEPGPIRDLPRLADGPGGDHPEPAGPPAGAARPRGADDPRWTLCRGSGASGRPGVLRLSARPSPAAALGRPGPAAPALGVAWPTSVDDDRRLRLDERGDGDGPAAGHHQERARAGGHPHTERKPGPPRLSWHFQQLLPRLTTCPVLHQAIVPASGRSSAPEPSPKG